MKKLTIGLALTIVTTSGVSAQQWVTSGANIYNSNTGNVGIGTTSPGQVLEIYNTSPLIKYNRAGSYSWESGVGSGPNIPLSFFGIRDIGANTIPFVIAHTTGKVGLGILAPQDNLSIGSTLGANVVFGLRALTSEGNSTRSLFTQDATTGSLSLVVDQGQNGSSRAFNVTMGAVPNAFYINSIGNVGIGTNNPTEKLAVSRFLSTGYNSMLSLNELSNNGSNSMGIDFKFGGLSGFPWGSTGRIEVARQLTAANFDMIFHTATAGVLSEKVRIMNNGNVGIGTTTPGAKLDVNGTTYSRKVFVGVPDANTIANMGTNNLLAVNGTAVFVKAKVAIYGTTWPDYVFSTTYQLTPLDSLEQFIKLNGHLPEVPIAKEVDKNGIDLGNNQVLLLKKVEQLTLYIIELKNKIDTKDKRIQQLESMNSRINLIEKEIKKMKEDK